MKEAFSVRDWVYIGLFGGLWGALELTLGSFLHLIFPPLADTFWVGIIMASAASVVALMSRFFAPHRGSILLVALIASLLKALSLGGVVIGPIGAIMAEALLLEAGLLVSSQPRRGAFTLAGALAVSWNFFHRFAMMRLLYGKGFSEVGKKMIADGSRLLGLEVSLALWLLGLLLLFRLLAGALAGILAWELGGPLRRRLSRRHED